VGILFLFCDGDEVVEMQQKKNKCKSQSRSFEVFVSTMNEMLLNQEA
jgi:hypothetical protein